MLWTLLSQDIFCVVTSNGNILRHRCAPKEIRRRDTGAIPHWCGSDDGYDTSGRASVAVATLQSFMCTSRLERARCLRQSKRQLVG
uniref:Secreted protein n=1 Tax=Ascaris lumbricoides TaxID=6252 RepID=A0A0M3HPR5_ASCLU